MKKSRLVLGVALALGMVSNAYALYKPPAGAPLYVKFDNKEQISPSNSILAPSGAAESNWGVIKVTSISLGDNSVVSQNFPPVGGNIWSDGPGGDEITGIFWGFQATTSGNPAVFDSTNGYLDLYWDSSADANLATAALTDRLADNTFTNFTDGDFLVRLAFMNGAIDPFSATASVTGTATPTVGGFTGIANSFANVVDVNSDGVIDALDGAWAALLDSNYFDTLLGVNTADIKLRSIYESQGVHDWDNVAGDVFGADSTDPVRAVSVPEPESLALLGIGLMGMGFAARRRKTS
jgi:hypothetical protein